MRKVWTIAWKDLLLNFRDPIALVVMLAAPLALTLVISAAFGGSGGSAAPENIPVVLVNQDDGQFSNAVVEAYQSQDLADLLDTSVMSDALAAREMVDADQFAAAVIIPPNFSISILPDATGPQAAPGSQEASSNDGAELEIYSNPSRPVGAGVVRSVADSILNHLNAGAASGQIILNQLLATGRITPEQIPQMVESLSSHSDRPDEGEQITVAVQAVEQQEDPLQSFNWMRYSAASMAILFLMFTMTDSARSILIEREGGTLPRMLTTPTPAAAVLGGKMIGAFLTGLAQMAILIVASRLLFGMDWGDPLGLVLLTVLLVAAVTGWAMIPAALSKTPGQANVIGTAITLSFAALAGNFVPRLALPAWLRTISLITPNAWGLEGYTALLAGQTAADIAPMLGALLAMAVIVFAVAVFIFRRQYAD